MYYRVLVGSRELGLETSKKRNFQNGGGRGGGSSIPRLLLLGNGPGLSRKKEGMHEGSFNGSSESAVYYIVYVSRP